MRVGNCQHGLIVVDGDADWCLDNLRIQANAVQQMSVVFEDDDLVDAPEIINTSPYEDGWMIKIRLSDTAELDGLLDADAYKEFVEEES